MSDPIALTVNLKVGDEVHPPGTRKKIERLRGALKTTQILAGNCYQGATERKPILVISDIWQITNEALAQEGSDESPICGG